MIRSSRFATSYLCSHSRNRHRCTIRIRSITTLWCGNVVYAAGRTNNTHLKSSSSSHSREGSVDISNGKIVACNPGEQWSQALERNPNGAQNLGRNMALSPGLIDVHTHISALGRNWEGYETATMAAAAGGITTLMGMPLNSLPSTTTLEAVEMEKDAAASGPLYVDVGLWGGVVPENLHNIKELLKSPYIFGLKAFLAPLPPAAGYQAVSPEQLKEAAKVCGPTSKPILVHSELMTESESVGAAKEAFAKQSPSSYEAHLASRPAKWEQDAVRVVCDASKDCHMHIVHLSDARGCLPIIQACKESPKNTLTVETCPHYLLLDESLIQDGEVLVKCFPPIRDLKNREMLWQGLSEGIIDMVASDHSPCEPHMRNMESGDIETAWGGLSGLQYQLQATWTDAKRRKFTSDDMAAWWSERPALLAGLRGKKGRIEEGQQADFCWWDPNHREAPNAYSKEYHRWKGATYFANNNSMCGRVMGTWVRGRLVYDGENDEHVESAGVMMTC